ncbi:2-oxo-4-hydroxy-4-carboxy-5-ureidoimidazoline decarboxylase [Actinosynnema sp. NPDC050436]|uniref:2-oxo-4-hydroxy-4-carboxy-5-ureidoimidazoline decarboxylase n=1 Tax=Actinosynnema sp. NPDC050436 TaxID=3155659 RepID=UPI0033CF8A9C
MSGLDDFNTAPAADLRPLLTECLAVPRWVDAVLAGRPYASEDALLSTARSLELGRDDARAALAGHSRIGERPTGGGASALWSATGQSRVGDPSAERVQAANAAYEKRFGHLYLVCTTGMSGEQVLADLTARLDHQPDEEWRVVSGELAKIAVLRLREVLHPHDP